MATTLYSKAMREKAEALAASSERWAYGTRNRDGVRFILFASCSREGIYYMTRIDGQGCTCPAARLSKRASCCHQLAALLVTERNNEQIERSMLTTYERLYRAEDEYQLTAAF